MKFWAVAPAALIAFSLALLFVPQTRWIPLNAYSMLKGEWNVNSYAQFGISHEWVYITPGPKLTLPSATAKSPAGQFFALEAPSFNPMDDQDTGPKMTTMVDLAIQLGQPRYLAHALRKLCLGQPLKEIHKQEPLEGVQRQLVGLMIECADRGAKIEPDNAYFPWMKAVALARQNRTAESDQAFIAASRLSGYNDYSTQEAPEITKLVQDRDGYRGADIESFLYGETLLPQFALFRRLGILMTQRDKPELLAANLRLGDNLMRHADSQIGLVVGVYNVISTLVPGKGASDPQVLSAALQLSKNPELAEAPAIAERAVRLKGHLPDPQGWPDEDDQRRVLTFQLGYSTAGFLSVMMLLLMSGMAWLKARYEKLAWMSPYFVWLMAFSMEQATHQMPESIAAFGLAFFVGLVGLKPSMRRYVDWAGLAISAWAIFSGFWAWPIDMVVLLFLIALATSRKVQEWRSWLAAPMLLAASVGAAVIWISILMRTDCGTAVAFGLVAALGLGGLAPAKTDSLRRTCTIAFAVLGIWVFTLVVGDILQDRTTHLAIQEFAVGANRLRDRSNVH